MSQQTVPLVITDRAFRALKVTLRPGERWNDELVEEFPNGYKRIWVQPSTDAAFRKMLVPGETISDAIVRLARLWMEVVR